jgi:hypothetical protein
MIDKSKIQNREIQNIEVPPNVLARADRVAGTSLELRLRINHGL